jgi:5-methylcytosine-specific restriction endonuclease McrA
MTLGTRKKSQRGSKRRYTVHGHASRRPCPRFATRLINDTPYCDVHGPSQYRADPYYESVAWRNLRHAVLIRDKFVCQYCGEAAHQADHVMPRSKGGADALENLVAVCRTCNRLAASAIFPSFAAKKRWLLRTRSAALPKDDRPTILLDRLCEESQS